MCWGHMSPTRAWAPHHLLPSPSSTQERDSWTVRQWGASLVQQTPPPIYKHRHWLLLRGGSRVRWLPRNKMEGPIRSKTRLFKHMGKKRAAEDLPCCQVGRSSPVCSLSPPTPTLTSVQATGGPLQVQGPRLVGVQGKVLTLGLQGSLGKTERCVNYL